MTNNRRYISIYFEDGDLHLRKKKDVTLSFNQDEKLYTYCKDLGSSKIKEEIGIYSYRELREQAKREGRSVNNLVKHLLRKAINE